MTSVKRGTAPLLQIKMVTIKTGKPVPCRIDARREKLKTRKQVGTSLLATEEIAENPTLRDRAKRMQEFETFCLARDMELDFQVPAKLKPALRKYLHHLYLEEKDKLASAQGLYSLSVWMDSPQPKFLGEYLERRKAKALGHALLFKHTLTSWLPSVRTAGTAYIARIILRKVTAPIYRGPII